MRRTFVLLLAAIALSCNESSKTPEKTEPEATVSENADWLSGKWKRTNDEAGKETFENWDKISAAEYSGHGFTLQSGDTVSQEKMRIVETDGKWSLLVTMPPAITATKFDVTIVNDKEFVCVNDSNDFPKKIRYWLEGEKMKAVISNDEMNIAFDFEKLK